LLNLKQFAFYNKIIYCLVIYEKNIKTKHA
jgi:hypothetical protein